ncbi:MAG TPA: right-handed parallel beta-helix repeat-containing protein [Candidatus Xenobia bacterium]|nr:right-handed parallel beta-helix repeat-containing protein [Candidatus Xenobia bacterium]
MEIRKEKIGRVVFCFLFSLFAVIPLHATTVSGTIKKPDGTPINGTIEFTLSQPAKTTTPPIVFAPVKTSCAVTAGQIAAGCTVQGNDTLDPAGTFYRVRVLDLNNLVVVPSANYTLSGAAVDLGSLPVTATDTLVPPTGSVTGNLNVTGNLTVGGSATFGADPESFFHLRLLGQTSDPATATSGSVFHRSDLNRLRFRAGGLEIFDGTQYLPVIAGSQGTIEFGANLSLPGLYSAAFKRLNEIRIVDPFLWLESGVPAKIDAASSDCGSLNCLVVLPSNLGAGAPTSLPANISLLDLRGSPQLQRLNRVLNANLFFGADIGAKVNAALAEIYATGGVVTVPAGAYSYSTPIVINRSTLGNNRTLTLDLNGAVLTYTGAAGTAALQVTGTANNQVIIENGVVQYGGANNNVYGVELLESNRTVVRNLHLRDFSTSGSEALRLSGTTNYSQNGIVENVYFRNNRLAISLRGTSNNNQFNGIRIDQDNMNPVLIEDGASGNLFVNSLIQSNTGTYGVEIRAVTQNAVGNSFVNCWFENNGDATANSRVIAFNPSAGRFVVSTSILGGAITAGTNGASGKAIAHIGAGTTQFVTIQGVQFNGWTSTNPAIDSGSQTRWLLLNNNGIPTSGNTGQWDFRVHNGADSSMQIVLNSGSSAAQNTDLEFQDRGTMQTRIRKSSSNAIEWADSGGLNRVSFASGLRTAYRSGQHHEFLDSSSVLRIRLRSDADAIEFGSTGDTRLERSAADTLSTGSNDKFRFTTGIVADGGGFKHARVSTGSIAASSSAAVTVSWTTAFADANYTANCSVVEATAGANSLRMHHLESVSASSVVVRVVNDDGATAKTGTVHCTAVHD